ncbi:hypothetical protein [Vibrio harveyi]|uniref:hypothetical protein n=1 Tax=Vibrio harveyi TaxID=669 RepID=UPI00390AD6F9
MFKNTQEWKGIGSMLTSMGAFTDMYVGSKQLGEAEECFKEAQRAWQKNYLDQVAKTKSLLT